jgi:hypothetical protein
MNSSPGIIVVTSHAVLRHARPCAGHPRLSLFRKQDVDGRDKARP